MSNVMLSIPETRLMMPVAFTSQLEMAKCAWIPRPRW